MPRTTFNKVTFQGHPFTITVQYFDIQVCLTDVRPWGEWTDLRVSSAEPWDDNIVRALWKELGLKGTISSRKSDWKRDDRTGAANFQRDYRIGPSQYLCAHEKERRRLESIRICHSR